MTAHRKLKEKQQVNTKKYPTTANKNEKQPRLPIQITFICKGLRAPRFFALARFNPFVFRSVCLQGTQVGKLFSTSRPFTNVNLFTSMGSFMRAPIGGVPKSFPTILTTVNAPFPVFSYCCFLFPFGRVSFHPFGCFGLFGSFGYFGYFGGGGILFRSTPFTFVGRQRGRCGGCP